MKEGWAGAEAWLLHAGAGWAGVAVVPPAYGLRDIVERSGFLLMSLGAAVKPEVGPVVMALRAGSARSLGEGGRYRASSAEEDDAAKDEKWPFHEGGSHHLSSMVNRKATTVLRYLVA
jgi:hypothetical protein